MVAATVPPASNDRCPPANSPPQLYALLVQVESDEVSATCFLPLVPDAPGVGSGSCLVRKAAVPDGKMKTGSRWEDDVLTVPSPEIDV